MIRLQHEFPAPAKLNLFLHVVGRRADGYHRLQTLFRFLDYGDRLGVTVRADGAIHLLDALPGVSMENNLCYRAARRLQQETGCRLGADIALDKRLPLGGGLGGGSSDAATLLVALNRLWSLGLPRAELQRLALGLGADVPVFVFGRSAFAEGVGERLQAVTLAPAVYVVLIPPVQVATAEIFASPGLTWDTPEMTIAALSAGCGHNDLEPVAVAAYPVIGEYLHWLGRFGDARMTGSGACVFAAFPDHASAAQVYALRPPEMKGFVAAGLDVHPMYALA